MGITLSPELEEVVRRDVASGRYDGVEEYLSLAIEALHERQELRTETLEEIQASLDEAIEAIERGEGVDEAQVRRELAHVKEEWMRVRSAA